MKNRNYDSKPYQPSVMRSDKGFLRKALYQMGITELVRKEGKLILGVSLFVWCWILVYSFVAYEPKYIAQSLVMIKDSAITARYVLPDQAAAIQTTSSNASNPVLNTMGLLKSNTLMESLWQFLHTHYPKSLKAKHLNTRQQWETFYKDGSPLIKAKNMPGTDLISIQFNWSNPWIAKQGLETVLSAFQTASLNINRAEQRSRSRYLNHKVQEISNRLKEIRKQKSYYKIKMKTINLVRESDDLSKARIDLGNELNLLQAKARGKFSEYARYHKAVGVSPDIGLIGTAIGQNSSMAKLQDQFYTLSQNHAFLTSTLTEKNPKVQEVEKQMERVQHQIQNENDRTLGVEKKGVMAIADATRGTVIGQMATSQAEAQNLSSQAQIVKQRLAEINGQIKAFPYMEETLANIEQEERALSTALDTLRQKELEAHLKEAETLGNVFIVDTPRLPYKAKFPSQGQLIFLGLFLGLASGLGVVFFKNKLIPSLIEKGNLVESYPQSSQLSPESLRSSDTMASTNV